MTFCLDSIIIKPEDGVEIKNAIILLHGYGGDGKDISMLSLNWKRHMPNTVFICPNGHEACAINPSGYQWFDLTKEDSDYILEQSIKAEEVLKKFINEIKQEFKLSNNQICLSGFSQGIRDSSKPIPDSLKFSLSSLDRSLLERSLKHNSIFLLAILRRLAPKNKYNVPSTAPNWKIERSGIRDTTQPSDTMARLLQ